MKKFRRLLVAFIVLLAIIMGTTACTVDDHNSDNPNNGDEPTKEEINTIPLLPGSSLKLIHAGEDGYTWDKTKITIKLTSRGIRYTEDATAENVPVLIIGEADHPLYRLAYSRL